MKWRPAPPEGNLVPAMRLPAATVILFALAISAGPGCARWEPSDYGPGPGAGLPAPTRPGGPPPSDGGEEPEPDPHECPPERDGVFEGGHGLVISEVSFGESGFIEFYNRGPGAVEANSVILYGSVGALSLPGLALQPGDWGLVLAPNLLPNGELLVSVDGVNSDYLCWGFGVPNGWQNLAANQGLWNSPGSCALSPGAGESVHLRGPGVFAADYQNHPPSPLGCEQ